MLLLEPPLLVLPLLRLTLSLRREGVVARGRVLFRLLLGDDPLERGRRQGSRLGLLPRLAACAVAVAPAPPPAQARESERCERCDRREVIAASLGRRRQMQSP